MASFLFKRLSALPLLDTVDLTYRMTVHSSEDGDLANAEMGVLKTLFTASLDSRLTALESGGGTPSLWPAARQISLAGPITGAVSMDGSQDVTLTVEVPAGAFPISAVADLAPTLLDLSNDASNHNNRLDTIEAELAEPIVAVSADKWTTARTLELTGKATAVGTWDGSANLNLDVTELSVSKADVGLASVDNTSDLAKPISTATQAALNSKAPLTGVGATGTWGIDISGKSASATKLATARNFSLSGVVTAPLTAFDGSGNLTLVTSVADGALDVASVAGLQTSLDGKLGSTATATAATKLATARAFSLNGVISTVAGVNFDGTSNVSLNTTIADAALSIAKTSGLQTALNSKADAADATLTGVPTAPTAAAGANTTQLATTAFVQAEIARDAPTKTGTGASGTWNISISGNADTASNASTAATATKLATGRAISLSGVVTATGVTFDGSGAITLNTAIADGALSVSKVSGLQGVLDGKVDNSSVSAGEEPNTIVQRNASGDMHARLFRSSYMNQSSVSGAIAYRVNNTTDTYIRFCSSPAGVNNWLGLGTGDNVTFATVSADRLMAGYDSGIAGSVSAASWFRSSGATGWYSQTYGGGIYMTDTTYVRTYANKQMAAGDFVISSDRRLKVGIRNFEYRGRLRPVNYLHKQSHSPDFGFIAQEVQALYPEAVGQMADSGMLQLSYPKLTAVLSHQVNRLEDELTELRKQFAEMSKASKPWWKRWS